MFAQITFGVVQEFAGQGFDRSFHSRGLVWRHAVPVARRFAVEPHLVVWIPAGMPDPTAQVFGAARDVEPVGQHGRIAPAQFFNRFAQFGRYALVGVNPEDPIAGRLRVGEFVFVLVAAKRMVEYLVRVAARDLDCAVVGIGIDDDDLVRPGHGFAHGGDVFFFVADDDGGGDFQGRLKNGRIKKVVISLYRICLLTMDNLLYTGVFGVDVNDKISSST